MLLFIMSWWMIVRCTCAIIVCCTILYVLRDVTRPIVTRFIPLARRMRPNFLKLQSRWTIGVNLSIALLAAIGTFVALSKLYRPPTTELETTVTIEDEQPPTQQFTLLPSNEKIEDTLLYEQPMTTEPKPYEETRPLRRQAGDSPTLPTTHWYLQIGAFEQLNGARQRHREQRQHGPSITYWGEEKIPYKVLVGPFETRRQAEQYRLKLKIEHFPRVLPPRSVLWLEE